MFAMVDWDWLPNASVDDGLDGRLRLGCLPRSHSHGSVSISGVHCTGGHLHRKVAVAVAVAIATGSAVGMGLVACLGVIE